MWCSAAPVCLHIALDRSGLWSRAAAQAGNISDLPVKSHTPTHARRAPPAIAERRPFPHLHNSPTRKKWRGAERWCGAGAESKKGCLVIVSPPRCKPGQIDGPSPSPRKMRTGPRYSSKLQHKQVLVQFVLNACVHFFDIFCISFGRAFAPRREKKAHTCAEFTGWHALPVVVCFIDVYTQRGGRRISHPTTMFVFSVTGVGRSSQPVFSPIYSGSSWYQPLYFTAFSLGVEPQRERTNVLARRGITTLRGCVRVGNGTDSYYAHQSTWRGVVTLGICILGESPGYTVVSRRPRLLSPPKLSTTTTCSFFDVVRK